jgi:hypothetical protein
LKEKDELKKTRRVGWKKGERRKKEVENKWGMENGDDEEVCECPL